MTCICLLALIGLPGSGKTSFSSWLRQQHLQINSNIIHLCFDDFLNDQFHNYKRTREDIIELLINIIKTLKATSQLPKQILHRKNIAYTQHETSSNYLIICDDNHYYRSMRYKLYQLCGQQQIHYAQIFFECDLDTALQRNKIRKVTDTLPDDVICQMNTRLEKPNTVTHSWESNTFALISISDKNNLNVFDFIRKSYLKKIVTVSNENVKQVCPNSKLHQLDLLLRKRIGELLMADTETKQLKVIQLNKKRKEILTQFKHQNNGEMDNMNNFDLYINLLN